MVKDRKVWFASLVILFCFRFFDIRILDNSLVNISVFAFLLLAILLSLPHVFAKGGGFIFPIQIILISAAVSILMAKTSWDQPWKATLIATVPFLIWIFFFYLLHFKIPVNIIEKIILYFGILYIVLYFFQLLNSSHVIFGKSFGGWHDTSFAVVRGIPRIVFPGAGVFYLTIFMAINKLTTQSAKKWLWRTIAILGVIVTVLQVTRQFIFFVSLIYFFHFTREKAIYKRVLILAGVAVLSLYVLNTDNPLVNGLTKQSETDLNKGDDYVRIQAAIYFMTDFSPHVFNRILGNGVPYVDTYYSFFIDYLRKTFGFYRSDVGIIGFYTMFGIGGVLGYLLIWIKSFTIPLPEEYQYLKYYLWLILLTSLTWYSVYNHGYLIITVFVLYLYHVISKENTKEFQLQ